MARARPFNLTAQINLRGPANIRTVVAGIRRQLGTISANVNVNIAPNAARSVTGLNTRLTRLNATLATTRTNVNDVTAAVNALSAAMRGLPPIPPIVPPGLPAARRDLGAIRSEMEEFGRQTGLAIRRFAAFTAGTAGIYALVNAVTKGVESFVAFNKEMVRLQQVTGESQDTLKRVSDEITVLSTSLGVASSDLLNVATTLAQAGLSARDTEKALKALALSALAPSFDDLNSTVEGSIALMRQFGIGAGDLEGALGSINSVAAKFAVEAGDIIAAIQRTGGVFASASRGVSEGTQALNEFVAIFTSVRQTTRESAETIATGLRTIFTRIQRASTIEALKEFGITLTDAEGKFVGAYKAVELLSQGLNRLDPRNLKFSEIVEELGGFRQIGKVIPLIQQFTTAQQALAVAQRGAGSLAEDAVTAQLSLANQLSKVREEFFALFREIGSSDSFQVMAKATLALASGLIKLADAAKGVLPIIGTIMAIRGIQGIGQFAAGFRGGIRPGGGRGAANGGLIRYANGGTVPAMVSSGEAYVPPETVKRIGVSKLKRMNQADRNGSDRYAGGGGIKVFKGPGSGTSDSIGPVNLPVGSFIIREKATKALGYSNGGKIQKFAKGVTSPKGIQPTAPPKTLQKFEQKIARNMYDKKEKTYNFGLVGLRSGTKKAYSGSETFDIIIKDKKKRGKNTKETLLSEPKKYPVRLFKSTLSGQASQQQINNIETDIANSFGNMVSNTAKTLRTILKAGSKASSSKKEQILKGTSLTSVIGSVFEAALGFLGSPYLDKAEQTKSMDFPLGLGSIANKFNIPPKIPTDATRTIGGVGKGNSQMKGQIRRFIEATESNKFTESFKKLRNRSAQEQAQAQVQAGQIQETPQNILRRTLNNVKNSTGMTYSQLADSFNIAAQTTPELSIGDMGVAPRITEKDFKSIEGVRFSGQFFKFSQDPSKFAKVQEILAKMTTPAGAMPTTQQSLKSRLMAKHGYKFKKQNHGGFIQNFADAGPVEEYYGQKEVEAAKAARKALKKSIERMFVDKKGRASFGVKRPVSMSENVSETARKRFTEQGRIVSNLSTRQQELLTEKIVKTQATVASKSQGPRRSRGLDARVLRNLAKTGIQGTDKKTIENAEKAIGLMTPEQIQKALAGDLKRAPPGQYLKTAAKYESDPEFRKIMGLDTGVSGGSVKQFEKLAKENIKKGIFERASYLDKIPDALGQIKSFRKSLNQQIAQEKDPKVLKSLQQQISKANTAIDVIEKGGVPKVAGQVTALSWAVRQAVPNVKELASGGEVPIMAQKGEYVINKRSAQSIGYDNLNKLNKYHTGGVVGDTPQKFFLGGGVDRDLMRDLRAQGYRGDALRAEYRRRKFRQGAGNAAMALSFAAPVVGEMIAGSEEPRNAGEASTKAFTTTASTGLGGALAVGSMGGPLGVIGGIAVGAAGLVKAFADAQDAVRSFNIKDATEKMNDQLELTTKSLDKFAGDINNTGLRTKALQDVLLSINKAQAVTTASETQRTGVFNLGDTGTGSFERSMILFERGVFDFLQTTARFGGGEANAAANQAGLFAKIIPKLAKERASQFGGASEGATRFLENEIKRTGSLDALKANKDEYNKLTSSLALADAQVQEQILNVQNNNNLSKEQKDATIKSIIALDGQNKAIDIANRAMREKALDELNKAASRAAFSLELMFTEMEQSINAANFTIDKMKESSDLVAASLSGQAKIGQTRLNAINILQNPRAYSTSQMNQASGLGASAFGADLAPAIQGLLKFGPQLSDTVMSTINQVLTTTPKGELNNEMIASKISRAVRQSLDRLNLPPELASKLSNEVGKQIEELRKSGEDKVDFSQLMEKVPALANVVDSAKRAQETAIQALENWQKNLNAYSESFNKITDLQVQNNERLRRSSDILYQGQLELAKAFGAPTNLRGVINNFNATISAMTGGLTSVGDITQQIQNLERIRQQQQGLQNDAGNRGQQGVKDFALMTNNLKNTNVKLRESYAALELLSQSSEVAAAAMSRIAELQQKQQAGIGVMEKIITSTPEELANFAGALQRLQVNMAGGVNFGTTAEQRGESLQAFNMLAPLLGQAEGGLKANVLESMLREANAPITPFFSQILDSLRNPVADPQMSQAIDIYRQSLRQQAAANTALSRLNEVTIKENADFAAKQIVEGFSGVMQSFESRQLANIASGINNLVDLVRNRKPAAGLAMGGVVYADNGMFVPKGTDTVPAMLTPGEFVVNRNATQKNLPLLRSINNGGKGYSKGGTVYFEDGGLVGIIKDGNYPGGPGSVGYKEDKLQTKTEVYDLAPDTDKRLLQDSLPVAVTKPVFYASATQATRSYPRNITFFPTSDSNQSTFIDDANNNISRMKLSAKPTDESPNYIFADILDWTTQRGSSRIFRSALGFKLLGKDSISYLENQFKTPTRLIFNSSDPKEINKEILRYINLSDSIIKSIPIEKEGNKYKYGNIKMVPSLSDSKQPNFSPHVKKTGNKLTLGKVAELGSDYIGPISPQYDKGASSLTKDNFPIGFHQSADFYGTTGRWTVNAGADNIGGFNPKTGGGPSLGNSIYQGLDISKFLSSELNKNYTNSAESSISIKDKIKENLANLKVNQEVEPSSSSIENKKFQNELKALINKKSFSKNLSEFFNIPGQYTLYNIRDNDEWNNLVKNALNIDDKLKPENFSKNTADQFILGEMDRGIMRKRLVRLPWAKDQILPKEAIETRTKDFIEKNSFVKVIPKNYTDNGLNFSYREILGKYYDPINEKFSGKKRSFITVPFGGENNDTNPFSGKGFSNILYAYYKDKNILDEFIKNIIDKTNQPLNPGNEILTPVIKRATNIIGDFPEDSKNNAFINPSLDNLNIPLNLDKFLEAFTTKRNLGNIKKQLKVPGAIGGPVGDLFNKLKDRNTLAKLSADTVRAKASKDFNLPDIGKLGGSLGYRLPVLTRGAGLLNDYVQYLNSTKSNITRDRRAYKMKGRGNFEVNEKFAQLYGMLDASSELFQAIASEDANKLSQIVGTDANNLIANGIVDINKIVQSVKRRAVGKAYMAVNRQAAMDISGQKTSALDDLLKTDAEAIDIAEFDNEGNLINFEKATAQNAKDKTVYQVGALALNPYNFFKGDSRRSLIQNGIIKNIDNKISQYRQNKRTPKYLMSQALRLLGDVNILRDWFSNIHDPVFNFDITDDLIKDSNTLDILKEKIDFGLGGRNKGFDSQYAMDASALYALSNAALGRVTAGTYQLGEGKPPTPLLEFEQILDLLIARKNIKINPVAPAAGAPAAGAPPAGAPAAGAGATPARPVGKAQGGLIYASNGTLVNFKPVGTDTVPAMLTPGEFVVNKKATQQNLGLLKSINSGNYATGGYVGSSTPTLNQNSVKTAVANIITDFNSTLNNVDKNTTSTRKDLTKLQKNNAQIVSESSYSRGGTVYASKGRLIPYQPKGTDTVPAMLTPGEFVINKQATQKNLGLLQAINSGNYATGGKVLSTKDSNPMQQFIKPKPIDEIKDPEDYTSNALRQRIREIDRAELDIANKLWRTEFKDILRKDGTTSYGLEPQWLEGFDLPPSTELRGWDRESKQAKQYQKNFEKRYYEELKKLGIFPNTRSILQKQLRNIDTPLTKAHGGIVYLARGGFIDQAQRMGLLQSDYNAMASNLVGKWLITDKKQEKIMNNPIGRPGPANMVDIFGNLDNRNIPNAIDKLQLSPEAFFENISTGKYAMAVGLDGMEAKENIRTSAINLVFNPREHRVVSAIQIFKKYVAAATKLRKEQENQPGANKNKDATAFALLDREITASKKIGGLGFEKLNADTFSNIPALADIPNGFKQAASDPNRQKIILSDLWQRFGLVKLIETNSREVSNILNNARRDNLFPEDRPKLQNYKDIIREQVTAAQNEANAIQTLLTDANIFGINAGTAAKAFGRIRLGKGALYNSNDPEIIKVMKNSYEKIIKANTLVAAGAAPAAGAPPAAPAGAPPVPPVNALPTNDTRRRSGPMYASRGAFVNFKPKGTDTVPAMLTPGEFVVNARATKDNLSLLQNLNSGAKAYNKGGIVYLQGGGGPVPNNAPARNNATTPNNLNFDAAPLQQFITEFNNSIRQFGGYIEQLSKFKVPDTINMNIVAAPIEVRITGSAALESMSEGMRNLVASEINKQMGRIWGQSGGEMGINPSVAQDLT